MACSRNMSSHWLNFLLVKFCLLITVLGKENKPDDLPTCDSSIFCHGDLLQTIQMSGDRHTKDFVDKNLLKNASEVLEDFNGFMKSSDNNPTEDDVNKFVDDHFEGPGNDFTKQAPKDWEANPKFLDSIKDPDLRKWASNLNQMWKNLTIKVKDVVNDEPERYSMIYVPNPVVVPGGRYREAYYWDSYWIMKGLLLCEMKETVKGMLENFAHLVDTYQMVPNGIRVYYSRRSQPPYFIPMVALYVDFTGDKQFVKDNIATLEKEFEFWKTKRSVDVKIGDNTYKLARYDPETSGPRPESYRKDVLAASDVTNDTAKQETIYKEIITGAETGWDYSSRWFIKDGTNQGNDISGTQARHIIPVDLNSLLCYNARLLSDFYKELEDEEKETKYQKEADDYMEAIEQVLWNDDQGIWLDYDLNNKEQRNYYYTSNFYPLWTGCFGKTPEDKEDKIKKALKYLTEKSDALEYKNGVPASVEESGQQWDLPYGWAPLQHMLVEALHSTNDSQAQELAFTISQQWIAMNYQVFKDTGFMYEKYNVEKGEGSGATGFGWTNGVALDLLDKYGERLESKVKDDSADDTVTYTSSAPKPDGRLLVWTGAAAIISVTVFILCLMKSRRKQMPNLRRRKQRRNNRGNSVEEMPLQPNSSDDDDSDTEFRIS